MITVGPRIYVALAALLFSTGGAAIKLSSMSSWQIAGLRSGIAAVVLIVLIPASRRFDLKALVVGVAFAATMILFVTANTLTTAASAIFLQTTAPVYVLLLGPLVLHERLRRTDVPAALLLGAGAVLFFVGFERPLVTAPRPGTGNLFAAASGVTWALTVVGLRWLGRSSRTPGGREGGAWGGSGDRDRAGAAVVLGSCLAFLFCLPFAEPLVGVTAGDWAIIGYLGVFQIGLAYVCLVRGVRGTRAFEVALLLVLEPVFSTILAWAVHGEVPGRWATAGSLIILLGLLLHARWVEEPS